MSLPFPLSQHAVEAALHLRIKESVMCECNVCPPQIQQNKQEKRRKTNVRKLQSV